MKTVTIIGGGLGGLTSGALLAKQGYKVTLLEQHNIVGGSATSFKRSGGFTCEVGLHEMDDVYGDKSKKAIFDALDVYEHIEFVKPDEFLRVITKNFDLTLPDERDFAIKLLCSTFPKETHAIKHYFELIQKIANEFTQLNNAKWWQYLLFPFSFRNIFKYKKASVKEVLDKITEHEELKLILNSNVGYYNDTIHNFSFLYHAIAQNSYFTGGGWYIKGGSQKLSNHLASIITNNGGEIIKRANVTALKTTNNTISSVEYTHKKETHRLSSDLVISNLAPFTTYNMAKIKVNEPKQIASSLLTVYLGFNKNLKELYGKRAYSTFMLNHASSMEEYDKVVKGDIRKKSFVFVDYSQIDSALVEQDKSVAVICTTDYLKDWESLSNEAYQQQKEEVLESYLNILEDQYPDIRNHLAFAEVGTAKTMQHYLKTPQGTAYGFAPTNKQFFRKPQIKSNQFDNLYFVGAWVMGGGFTPAILSGGMCAKEIVKTKA